MRRLLVVFLSFLLALGTHGTTLAARQPEILDPSAQPKVDPQTWVLQRLYNINEEAAAYAAALADSQACVAKLEAAMKMRPANLELRSLLQDANLRVAQCAARVQEIIARRAQLLAVVRGLRGASIAEPEEIEI